MDFRGRKCYKGTSDEADCTFTMSQSDFVALFEGEANSADLFMSQKLKIDGDLSVAMQFQSVADQLDPEMLSKAAISMTSGGGGGGSSGGSSNFRCNAAFKYIAQQIQQDKKTAADITNIFTFNIHRGNETVTWTLDFVKRSVTQGAADNADCTFTMSDDDFIGLLTREKDPMGLFMEQKLKMDGDMAAAMGFQGALEEIPLPADLLASLSG